MSFITWLFGIVAIFKSKWLYLALNSGDTILKLSMYRLCISNPKIWLWA
jgi:hypothetical protein